MIKLRKYQVGLKIDGRDCFRIIKAFTQEGACSKALRQARKKYPDLSVILVESCLID